MRDSFNSPSACSKPCIVDASWTLLDTAFLKVWDEAVLGDYTK